MQAKKQVGMTLIELLITIAIVGICSSGKQNGTVLC